MGKKALVIAGNYKQFWDWLRENNFHPFDYVYVDENSWRGFHNIQVIKIGTWYERKDIDVEVIENLVGFQERG